MYIKCIFHAKAVTVLTCVHLCAQDYPDNVPEGSALPFFCRNVTVFFLHDLHII